MLTAGQPLTLKQLKKLFYGEENTPSIDDIRSILNNLGAAYVERGMELREVAGGWRLQIGDSHIKRLARVQEERPPRLSRALLETLAIIAYRQPITRAEIEEIRGVSLTPHIIHTLQEREWIKIAGHRDTPGRPELLITTPEFLNYFNLKHLRELPPLAEPVQVPEQNDDLFSPVRNEAVTDDTPDSSHSDQAAPHSPVIVNEES